MEIVLLGVLVYLTGMMIWNFRALRIYHEQISKPWNLAISRHCSRQEQAEWFSLSQGYPLQGWDYVLLPWRWVINWNWKPKIEEVRRGK